MKILLCENPILAATGTARKLRELGHTLCGTATSARECLEMAFLVRPDLVLVGLGEDGTKVDLLEALVRLGIPALLIPGEAQSPPEAPAAKAGRDIPSEQDPLAVRLAGVKVEQPAPSAADPLTEALRDFRDPVERARGR